MVVIQDELAAEELVPVLEDGGLDPYLATVDPTRPLPTLGSMVESGRRLIVGLEKGDLGPAIPNVYDGGRRRCRIAIPRWRGSRAQVRAVRYRGQEDAPLFLLNHWVSPPSSDLAAEANSEDVLLARAEHCSEERGRPVNLVAVDFDESGDLLATVDELNAE